MAGTKLMTMKVKQLEDIGEDVLFDKLASGSSVNSLIKECGIGKRVFYKWMRGVEGRERALLCCAQGVGELLG